MADGSTEVGGGFLIDSAPIDTILVPEFLTEEHQAVSQTAAEFVRSELSGDAPDLPGVLRRAADLGLTAVLIPEAVGGMELDFTSAALVASRFGVHAGLVARYAAHSGASTLPILYNGSSEQQDRLLPRIAAGETIVASHFPDKLAAAPEVKAFREDEDYVLNTIGLPATNADTAGVFVLAGWIEESPAVFLVERGLPGVRINGYGEVELESVRVGPECILGIIGEADQIADQSQSAERILLAHGAVGGIETCLAATSSLSEIPAGSARQELAELALTAYVAESVAYRIVGTLTRAGSTAASLREFYAECALSRAFCSDALGRALDAATRLRFWVNRRLAPHALSAWRQAASSGDWITVAQTLIDRARQGRLALPVAAKALPGDIASLPVVIDYDNPSKEALAAADNAKRAVLLCLGAAFRSFGGCLDGEPEIMERVGKVAGLAYGIESVGMRALRTGGAGASPEIGSVYTRRALAEVEALSRSVVAACASGDTLRTDLALLHRLTNIEPVDSIRLRRKIADLLTKSHE